MTPYEQGRVMAEDRSKSLDSNPFSKPAPRRTGLIPRYPASAHDDWREGFLDGRSKIRSTKSA